MASSGCGVRPGVVSQGRIRARRPGSDRAGVLVPIRGAVAHVYPVVSGVGADDAVQRRSAFISELGTYTVWSLAAVGLPSLEGQCGMLVGIVEHTGVWR